jgi:uncharacterized protein YaaR (DUF327 family)
VIRSINLLKNQAGKTADYSIWRSTIYDCTITGSEVEERCSNLLRRYEEMLSRLVGTYQIPNKYTQEGERDDRQTGSESAAERVQAIGQKMEKLTKAIEKTEKAPVKKVAIKKTKTVKAKPIPTASKCRE